MWQTTHLPLPMVSMQPKSLTQSLCAQLSSGLIKPTELPQHDGNGITAQGNLWSCPISANSLCEYGHVPSPAQSLFPVKGRSHTKCIHGDFNALLWLIHTHNCVRESNSLTFYKTQGQVQKRWLNGTKSLPKSVRTRVQYPRPT